MSLEDRDSQLAVSPDGLVVQARMDQIWAGGRGAVGVRAPGRYYYEAVVEDEGLCRVGWSTMAAKHDLGTDSQGFGYGGTGKKSHNRQFVDYGEPYGKDDVIGCLLDLDAGVLSFTKNGKVFGPAFEAVKLAESATFYPAVVLKNAQMRFTFGGAGSAPFAHKPEGFVGLGDAPAQSRVSALEEVEASAAKKAATKACPTAIVLEPSMELATQTHANFELFARHLPSPRPRCVLLIAGKDAKQQARELANGCDILVATPGKAAEVVVEGRIGLNSVQFYCLDEADRLVDSGNQQVIMTIYNKIPKAAKRLQMLLFSATLHSMDIRRLSEALMPHATWVDLRGKDSVPDTVHNALVRIDPAADRSWETAAINLKTDGVHAKDRTGPNDAPSPEALSERVKLLKGLKLIELVDAKKMERCMIFVRTKLDCDNLEAFLAAVGKGQKFRAGSESGPSHPYSCAVLHGDRSPAEREANLSAFRNGQVRFLICTDVAARGIDVAGLPYMINFTLPDSAEQYIHRIGRVGRADNMGLAVSLVSTVREKVWFHRCPSKGKGCTDTNKCVEWYDEPALLRDVEARLHSTIPSMAGPDYSVTFLEGVVYGQKRGQGEGSGYKSHAELLKPAVKTLGLMERQAQVNFHNFGGLF